MKPIVNGEQMFATGTNETKDIKNNMMEGTIIGLYSRIIIPKSFDILNGIQLSFQL